MLKPKLEDIFPMIKVIALQLINRKQVKHLQTVEQIVWALLLDNVIDGSDKDDKTKHDYESRIEEDTYILQEIIDKTDILSPKYDCFFWHIYISEDLSCETEYRNLKDDSDGHEFWVCYDNNVCFPYFVQDWIISFENLLGIFADRNIDFENDFIKNYASDKLKNEYNKFLKKVGETSLRRKRKLINITSHMI